MSPSSLNARFVTPPNRKGVIEAAISLNADHARGLGDTAAEPVRPATQVAMMQPSPAPQHVCEDPAPNRLAVGSFDAEIMGNLERHIDDEEHGVVAESRVGAASEPPSGATFHDMRRGAGCWQRKLLAHLNQYGAFSVGSLVKRELGRTPTRAQTGAARRAAHTLADAGQLWIGYQKAGLRDENPRMLWVFPVGSPRPVGVHQTHDPRSVLAPREPHTYTRGAKQGAKSQRTRLMGP